MMNLIPNTGGRLYSYNATNMTWTDGEHVKRRAVSNDFTLTRPAVLCSTFANRGHSNIWIETTITSISPLLLSFSTGMTFNIALQQLFAPSWELNCTFWRIYTFWGLIWENRRQTHAHTQRAGRDIKDQWKYFVQIWHSIFLYMRLCFVNAFVFVLFFFKVFLKGISP